MAEIGSFALLLALALSVYTFFAGIVALAFQKQTPQPSGSQPRASVGPSEGTVAALLRRGSERIGETARRAGIATFAAVFLASVVLVICAFRDDFTIAYIFHHSNRDLPGPYKFATLWSGQEGSLLFWSLLLAAYGFVLRLRYKTDPRLFAYASVVLAGVQIFFLMLVNFAANPFGILEGALRRMAAA
jgi:cytochrome c-type biogenesis protein CcmF